MQKHHWFFSSGSSGSQQLGGSSSSSAPAPMLPLNTLVGQTWPLSLHFLEVVEVCSFWKVMKNSCICA
jgi:hypothetical protein